MLARCQDGPILEEDMRTTLVRTYAPVALALGLLALAACNTVEGAGRDLSATGRTISNTADRAAPR
jgi:predicted small secreted protein